MFESLHQFFSVLAHESATSGKISIERICPFCGSHLSDKRLEGMKVRLGRLQFLFRTAEKQSPTAKEILFKIFARRKYIGGIDVPENYPEWWVQIASRIYEEEAVADGRKKEKDVKTG